MQPHSVLVSVLALWKAIHCMRPVLQIGVMGCFGMQSSPVGLVKGRIHGYSSGRAYVLRLRARLRLSLDATAVSHLSVDHIMSSARF